MTDVVTMVETPVRSVDMDADRVVNNAVYFMYFEQARLAHLQQLGVIHRPRRPEDPTTFTIAATEARFLAPLVFPDTVKVTAWTREVRVRSFVLAYRVVRLSDGRNVAEGTSSQVWLDEFGKPAPLPDLVRDALERSVAPDAALPDNAAAAAHTASYQGQTPGHGQG